MVLLSVKYLLVVFISLFREIIIIKAETIDEADDMWFSFLYDFNVKIRTIEEYICMGIQLGYTEEDTTEQGKIDGGIWYPIIIGRGEDGKPLELDLTIPEYNGDVVLSDEVADVIGKDDDGKIKPEIKKLIPLFLIASTENKKFKGKSAAHLTKESRKGKQGYDAAKLMEVNEEANAETVLLDWQNVRSLKTGEIVKFTKPLARDFITKFPSTGKRILAVANEPNNYLKGTPVAEIEATAEK